MDALLDGPGRLAAGLGELSRGRLDQGRPILAGLEAGKAEVARSARARFDARKDEAGARAAGGWQSDDRILALSGEQQSCPVFATAERLTGCRRGGAAAAGREAG